MYNFKHVTAHLQSWSAPNKASPMTFLPFLLNRSKLPICSYYFFLFWPVTLQTVKKRKKEKKYLCMYIDKQNQLKKKKYYFFLFWPVTLQTLNGSSTVLFST